MVLLPIGADQPLNAARCAALDVARVIDPFQATSADVASAAEDLLADVPYRRNAQRVQEEIAALPGPEYALHLLEQLTRRSPEHA
jgi:UDP:flavonoid glycosyltransferase YjiC (YdhE family)